MEAFSQRLKITGSCSLISGGAIKNGPWNPFFGTLSLLIVEEKDGEVNRFGLAFSILLPNILLCILLGIASLILSNFAIITGPFVVMTWAVTYLKMTNQRSFNVQNLDPKSAPPLETIYLKSQVRWLFTQQIHPELDGSINNGIRARMAKVMFDEQAKPDA